MARITYKPPDEFIERLERLSGSECDAAIESALKAGGEVAKDALSSALEGFLNFILDCPS